MLASPVSGHEKVCRKSSIMYRHYTAASSDLVDWTTQVPELR